MGADGKDHLIQEVRRLNNAYECFSAAHDKENGEGVAGLVAGAESARETRCRPIDAERRAELYGGTFRIPEREERESLREGDWVRLLLADGGAENRADDRDHQAEEDEDGDGWAQERLWVVVSAVKRPAGEYEGVLVQRARALERGAAQVGDRVAFSARHVSRLGVREGHAAWYHPDAAVCVSRHALGPSGRRPVRFAAALEPLSDEGVLDSGWVLLCGGEDPGNRDHFIVLSAAAAATVCPGAEILFAFRPMIQDGSAFRRAREEDDFEPDTEVGVPPE